MKLSNIIKSDELRELIFSTSFGGHLGIIKPEKYVNKDKRKHFYHSVGDYVYIKDNKVYAVKDNKHRELTMKQVLKALRKIIKIGKEGYDNKIEVILQKVNDGFLIKQLNKSDFKIVKDHKEMARLYTTFENNGCDSCLTKVELSDTDDNVISHEDFTPLYEELGYSLYYKDEGELKLRFLVLEVDGKKYLNTIYTNKHYNPKLYIKVKEIFGLLDIRDYVGVLKIDTSKITHVPFLDNVNNLLLDNEGILYLSNNFFSKNNKDLNDGLVEDLEEGYVEVFRGLEPVSIVNLQNYRSNILKNGL